MYGYVLPDKPNMFVKDYSLYKAFYCGLCKSTGKMCGQLMRFTTNYDMTFLNVLYHAILDKEVKFSEETCILNPIKKKSVVDDDELTHDIIDINNILSHYKCIDDVIDNKSLDKKIADDLVIKSRYNKSKKKFVKIDEIVSKGYNDLRLLEESNCGSVDRVAHPFANIMQGISKELFKDKYTEEIGEMMYALGKWVYIMDAIDDIDDDYKEGKFNLFLVNYEYNNKEQFLLDKKGDLEFILMNCYNTIRKNFDKININKYEGVLTNILWYGILTNTKDMLTRKEKCKKIRI